MRRIPEHIPTSIAVILAKKWNLDSELTECARNRNSFNELREGPFSLQDILDIAVVIHRHYHHSDNSVPKLEDCHAFKKLETTMLLRDTAERFLESVENHARLIIHEISRNL